MMFEEKYCDLGLKKKKLDDGKKQQREQEKWTRSTEESLLGKKDIAVVYFNHEVGV